MKLLNILPFLFFAFVGNTLEKPSVLKKALLGTWVYTNHAYDSREFYKELTFAQNEPGIQFQKDGKLIKRQNAGWCGTPPITYNNSEGTWKVTSDSTIIIRYKYWGGTTEEEWLIQEVDKDYLRIEVKEFNPKAEE